MGAGFAKPGFVKGFARWRDVKVRYRRQRALRLADGYVPPSASLNPPAPDREPEQPGGGAVSEERDRELRSALLGELVEEAAEFGLYEATLLCGDVSGPNGVGGPCVLPAVHGFPHRDGIGGEWPVPEEATARHAALVGWLSSASLEQLRVAVAAVLAEHRPGIGVSINALNCPDHHPTDNTEGFIAAQRASNYRSSVFESCEHCVVTTYVTCTSTLCCDGWPCAVTDVIVGALGLSLAELDELHGE